MSCARTSRSGDGARVICFAHVAQLPVGKRAFGECEYWLAFIKVFAIIFFIICGCYLIYLKMHGGWQPELRVHGSYFPNGWTAVIECMAVVIYSFQGAEVVGNIASEAKNPSEVLPKVIRGIGVRIVLFYILSVGVLAILEPEGYTAEASGPFVSVFKELGIPGTDTFMKLVILSATLSAANSGIYVCSRMLWSMGNAGMAPKCFSKLSGVYPHVQSCCARPVALRASSPAVLMRSDSLSF